jgi:hypothetical protein
MRKLEKFLFMLMPLMLFLSNSALANGDWHTRLHEFVLTLPPWLQCFVWYLHMMFGWGIG